MQESDIPKRIEQDAYMMGILRAVRTLHLPDWWIGAGFVRNKIWDILHGQERNPSGDIDVVYFDPKQVSENAEKDYQQKLETLLPTGQWSVTNQARMHAANGEAPYRSSLDAISHWPETATAVAITLDGLDRVIFKAPLGADDLLNIIIRPTPAFEKQPEKYRARMAQKNWQAKWPRVTITM